jgi:hypothetical protein
MNKRIRDAAKLRKAAAVAFEFNFDHAESGGMDCNISGALVMEPDVAKEVYEFIECRKLGMRTALEEAVVAHYRSGNLLPSAWMPSPVIDRLLLLKPHKK